VPHDRDDFTRRPERHDVVVDNVANHRLSHLRRVLTRTGTLVPSANTGRWLGGLGRTIRALVMGWFVPQRVRPFVAAVNQHDLVTLGELIESGKITPVIDRTYPLTELPGVIGYLEQGHARGKVVITMQRFARTPLCTVAGLPEHTVL
jgi:NADPH:quinone reductase-like Zn-dependent oxidoreductase